MRKSSSPELQISRSGRRAPREPAIMSQPRFQQPPDTAGRAAGPDENFNVGVVCEPSAKLAGFRIREGTNPQMRMPRASAAPRAPSTAMRDGFACTFHGHPYGEYLNMFLN